MGRTARLAGNIQVVESIAIEDVFSSGLNIEPVDDGHLRLIWFVDKGSEDGRIRVPVGSIVVSTTSALAAAQQLARAHALARLDFVKIPAGCG